LRGDKKKRGRFPGLALLLVAHEVIHIRQC
jgi:hypothetical protein